MLRVVSSHSKRGWDVIRKSKRVFRKGKRVFQKSKRVVRVVGCGGGDMDGCRDPWLLLSMSQETWDLNNVIITKQIEGNPCPKTNHSW